MKDGGKRKVGQRRGQRWPRSRSSCERELFGGRDRSRAEKESKVEKQIDSLRGFAGGDDLKADRERNVERRRGEVDWKAY